MHAPHVFDAICFDCDSTLSRIEGVDELGVRAGCVDLIAPLTTAAMAGTIAIEEVYARRMDLIKPDREALAWVGARYVEDIVEGASATIAELQARGKSVHIVSGGLLQPILVLAAHLGIPAANVHAVAVNLDGSGAYLGFDTASPLTRARGKAEVVAAIARVHGRVALVGDGITDVRAREGGAYVVGFGGVVARAVVIAGADVFVSGPSLAATLPALLTRDEH